VKILNRAVNKGSQSLFSLLLTKDYQQSQQIIYRK
jgi:hypothetical protein